MKKTGDIISAMVAEEAAAFGAFIVGHSHGLQGLYRYYIDSAGPLTLNTITEITRKVSVRLDEADLGDSPFTFEISTPGADKPLTDIRQFSKHINRNFSLKTTSHGDFEARLTAVNDKNLEWEKTYTEKVNGKKTIITENITIPFEDIQSATIKLAFK